MFQALQDEASRTEVASPDPVEDVEREADEERIFVCRRCETAVATHRQLFAMRAASFTQVFPNPHGHMKVIYTFRDARAVRPAGLPTDDFTWFEGYTWRVAYCAACDHHLGWLFERAGGGEGFGGAGSSDPAAFYGLLKDELTELHSPRSV